MHYAMKCDAICNTNAMPNETADVDCCIIVTYRNTNLEQGSCN